MARVVLILAVFTPSLSYAADPNPEPVRKCLLPVAVHAWLSHQQDYRQAIMEVVRCGGDTDSTAAIVGGIVGCSVGKEGIPADWLQGFCEWPRTVSWMERLAEQLHSVEAGGDVFAKIG